MKNTTSFVFRLEGLLEKILLISYCFFRPLREIVVSLNIEPQPLKVFLLEIMKYNEIEQNNEVKDSNVVKIEEECVGEECYYRMPLDYLQDKRIQADLRLYFYLCNYSNSRNTDIVEVSIETMMKRIGITNRKIIFQTLDKLKRRGDIEIIGKRGNVRTIKVRSENSYSELTNELARTNQSKSENSYSELTNELVETNQELVRTNQSNSENLSNSLEDSTLQTLPEKPNNYINNYNKNKPLNTLYTKYLIGKDNKDKKEDKMSTENYPQRETLSDNVAVAPKNNKKEIEEKVLRFCFKDYPYDHYIPKRTVAEWLKDFAPLSNTIKKAVRKHNLTARGIERYGKWHANDMYECNLNLVDRIADDIAEVYYAPIPKTQSNLTKEESKLYEEILLASSDKAGLRYREYAERYPTEWRKAIYQLRKDYNDGKTEHYYISML